MTEARQHLLADLAAKIATLKPDSILRVAIDGVDGAGKTHFGDELAELLKSWGRPIIRAGVDGFHHPRALRYRRGRDSPEGFYADSYDYPALRSDLLDPLSAKGSGLYRQASFDHQTDSALNSPLIQAQPTSILLFDGIFLHRPDLVALWDFSIFLAVDFAISIPRGAQRGMGDPDPAASSNRRYIEGQKLYLSHCQPQLKASLVIDNNDLLNPRIIGVFS